MNKIDKFRVNFLDKPFIILMTIVLIGGLLRFYRLGALPFDGDNSYHALAAKAILESGKPEMPDAELYLRSFPLMYLEALSLKIFDISEWSLRFPNALIGTINIILVYLLIKTLWSEKRLAIVTALFFSLSPWAIYMARMPRMYEPLLMAVLLTWILFFNWYYLNKWVLIIPLILASVTSISLHDVAIIPLSCFIVPLLLEQRFRKDTMISAGCFVALFAFWFKYPSMLSQLFK